MKKPDLFHPDEAMSEPTLVIVPAVEGKIVRYNIYKVKLESILQVLPQDAELGTRDFNAAQAYVRGFYGRT